MTTNKVLQRTQELKKTVSLAISNFVLSTNYTKRTQNDVIKELNSLSANLLFSINNRERLFTTENETSKVLLEEQN